MNKLLQEKGFKIIRNIIPHYLLDNMIIVIAKRFTEITKIQLTNNPIINPLIKEIQSKP